MIEHFDGFLASKLYQITMSGSCRMKDQPYVTDHFSLLSVGEKLLLSSTSHFMADPARAESRRKAVTDPSRRPLSQLNTKERGMRAASECIKGTLSPHSAQAQYGVDRHCLRYYRKQLMESGFAAAVEAASTPALAAVDDAPSTREESSTGKSKTRKGGERSRKTQAGDCG